MKRPLPLSILVASTLVAGTAAFSPSPLSPSLLFAARPEHRSDVTARGVSHDSHHKLASRTTTAADRRVRQSTTCPSTLILASSLKETFETEATNNKNETQQTQTVQQQLQLVLSSPELLDPAAILDATIGIADENGDVTVDSLTGDTDTATTTVVTVTSPLGVGAATILDTSIEIDDIEITQESAVASDEESLVGGLDNIESSVTAVTPPAATTVSKQEDLELTRQAIMNHIDPSSDGAVEDEDDLDDSQVLEQSKSNKSILDNTPTVSKILRYTIPAIGIWLCSPVLSMIDTAAVGLLSGTAQQAALNPAVSVSDYSALVVAFMYTATTNLIAAAVQEDKDNIIETGQPRTTTTLVTSLKLAMLVGSVFGVILGTTGKTLLKVLIGNDSINPEVFSAALQYVRIRSLGLPAMVVIGTAQSACLGMQDVKSPLYVLAAAAVINFFGDVLLVPMAGSNIFGGAAGAAWATVASQYAALLFFGRWLTTAPPTTPSSGAKKRNLFSWMRRNSDGESMDDNNNGNTGVVDVTQGIMELTGTSKAGRSRRKEFRKFLSSSKLSRRVHLSSKYESLHPEMATNTSNKSNIIRPLVQEKRKKTQPIIRGFLSDGKLTLRKYFSFSKSNFNTSKAREFLPFVVPVTTTSVGRISGYIAMSHVASSTLGTYDMAGHQIVFSIFCCLTPFVDALSQVAQSFVPAIFEAKQKSTERALALRKTINNFRKVGLGFGAVLVALVAGIPLISRFFTTDPIVLERVIGAIPGVALFLIVNGLMCAGEGSLLGQKDLKFLRNMYAIFFFTVPGYMLRLKHRSLAGVQTVGIGTMWAAFATYNVIRTAIWHLRLAQLQRRTDRGVVAAVEEEGDKISGE